MWADSKNRLVFEIWLTFYSFLILNNGANGLFKHSITFEPFAPKLFWNLCASISCDFLPPLKILKDKIGFVKHRLFQMCTVEIQFK